MATIKKQENISVKTFIKNICSEIAIKAIFPFSHYNPMETWRCHWNKSTKTTAIKYISIVEANLTNISANFQLYSPYGYCVDFCKKNVLEI